MLYVNLEGSEVHWLTTTCVSDELRAHDLMQAYPWRKALRTKTADPMYPFSKLLFPESPGPVGEVFTIVIFRIVAVSGL